MAIDKAQLNQSWLQVLNDPTLSPDSKSAELQKLASGIVRTFVEQEGFTGKIIPAEPLMVEQCIPTGVEGEIFALRPIDRHKVYAVETSRTALPTGNYVTAQDYKIWMTYRESQMIEKDIRTLQNTYTYDVQDIFENRIGLELQKATDRIFMNQVWTGLGYDITDGSLSIAGGTRQVLDLRTFWGVGTGKSRGLTSEMIVQATQKFGKKYLSDAGSAGKPDQFVFGVTENPLMPFTVLMNLYDYQDLSEMPASEIGSWLRAEFFQQYNSPVIKNVQIVTTIHQDLVPPGTMYFFAKPEFIGHNFEIDPIQVLTRIDTFTNEFKMKGRTFAGQGIGNAYGIWEMKFTPRGEDNPAEHGAVVCPILN